MFKSTRPNLQYIKCIFYINVDYIYALKILNGTSVTCVTTSFFCQVAADWDYLLVINDIKILKFPIK